MPNGEVLPQQRVIAAQDVEEGPFEVRSSSSRIDTITLTAAVMAETSAKMAPSSQPSALMPDVRVLPGSGVSLNQQPSGATTPSSKHDDTAAEQRAPIGKRRQAQKSHVLRTADDYGDRLQLAQGAPVVGYQIRTHHDCSN